VRVSNSGGISFVTGVRARFGSVASWLGRRLAGYSQQPIVAGVPLTLPQAALLLAALAVFVDMARAHVWLCDDAFISFRYVDKWLEGAGLVFNRGDRVEGYTNFLWVVELAALKKLVGVEPPAGAQLLSFSYTAATVGLTAWVAARTPHRTHRAWITVLSLVLLLTERSFAVWSSGGLETRQFTFFVLLGYAALTEGRDRWWARVGGSLSLAAAQLTRPEGLMLATVGVGAFVLQRVLTRRLRVRAFVEVVLPVLAITLGHFVWRRLYYGDWLPNTYYAKHVRPWWDMGAVYFGALAIESALYLLVPLAIAGAILRSRRGRLGFLELSLVGLALHAFYVAQIGGDHFEFRPCDFWWPILSLGSAEAIVWAGARLVRKGRPFAGVCVSAALFAFVLAHARVLEHAQWRFSHRLKQRHETAGLVVHVDADRFPPLHGLPLVKALLPTYNAWLRELAGHSVGLRFQEHKVFWKLMAAEYGGYRAYDLGHLLPPDAVMSHGNIGVISYSLPSITLVDEFGLTDRVIARTKVERSNSQRQMAHDRRPPPGYLERRGVNMVPHPFQTSYAAARSARYVLELSPEAFLPFDSPWPDWVRTAFADRPLWAVWFADAGRAASQTFVRAGMRRCTGYRNVDLPRSGEPSEPFVLGANDAIAFLLRGGQKGEAGLELLSAEKSVERWIGQSNAQERVVASLQAHAGRELRLRTFGYGRPREATSGVERLTLARCESLTASEP
jgi:arabinofuranosyltransferase